MKLTLDQVRHVATLARLSLSTEEEQRYVTQLSAILEAVEQLGELDTTEVVPTSHAHVLSQVLREDLAQSPSSLERSLANAPAKVGTSFAVPKIIE